MGRSRIQSQAILLSFVPLAFLVVFLVLVAVLVERTSAMTIWTQHAAQVLDQSDAILKTLGDANRAATDYTLHPSKTSLQSYGKSAALLRAETDALVNIVTVPEQKQRAMQFRDVSNRIIALLDKYLGYMKAKQPARARALAAAPSTRALGSQFQTTKATFDRVERQLTGSRFRELRSQVQTIGWILLAATFLGIVLTLFTTARFGVRIADRLQRLAANAERLGAGKTTEPVEGDDEIAALDAIYHEMAQRIRATLSAYQREHDIASTLQDALLPQDLPSVPGLRIDTAYAAAAHKAEVGGDWYDVFSLDHETVGISMGDVAGHGLRSAVIMGSVRQGIRAAARIDRDPATVLSRANRALYEDEDIIVTAFYATLDRNTGEMRYAVAGHPLPIAIRSEGHVEQLEGEGMIFGADPNAEFRTFQTSLRVGEGLVCFTDGIIEVERDYFKGLRDLMDAVGVEHARALPQNIAERIRDRLLANREPADDSALLFIGVVNLGVEPGAHERTWRLDASKQGASYRVRRAVLWDLSKHALPASDLNAAELIVGELLSNVARHTPGEAEVRLEIRGGVALLNIRDRGNPFSANGSTPDPLAVGGRGLYLVKKLARRVSFESNASGNSVSVELPVQIAGAA